MGKHHSDYDRADEEEGSFKGDLPTGELKEQLSDKAKFGDGHVPESSQSPIETW